MQLSQQQRQLHVLLHLLAGLVDVGQQRAPLVAHAAADDDRTPGVMCSGWMMPGTPAAAITMSARRV